jgi:hypothetical protein
MEGSCRFGAQGAMIRHLVGKKLPLARAGTTLVVIGTSFIKSSNLKQIFSVAGNSSL